MNELEEKLNKYILHWADCGIHEQHHCVYKNCPHESYDKGYCTCDHDSKVQELLKLSAPKKDKE